MLFLFWIFFLLGVILETKNNGLVINTKKNIRELLEVPVKQVKLKQLSQGTSFQA